MRRSLCSPPPADAGSVLEELRRDVRLWVQLAWLEGRCDAPGGADGPRADLWSRRWRLERGLRLLAHEAAGGESVEAALRRRAGLVSAAGAEWERDEVRFLTGRVDHYAARCAGPRG